MKLNNIKFDGFRLKYDFNFKRDFLLKLKPSLSNRIIKTFRKIPENKFII